MVVNAAVQSRSSIKYCILESCYLPMFLVYLIWILESQVYTQLHEHQANKQNIIITTCKKFLWKNSRYSVFINE